MHYRDSLGLSSVSYNDFYSGNWVRTNEGSVTWFAQKTSKLSQNRWTLGQKGMWIRAYLGDSNKLSGQEYDNNGKYLHDLAVNWEGPPSKSSSYCSFCSYKTSWKECHYYEDKRFTYNFDIHPKDAVKHHDFASCMFFKNLWKNDRRYMNNIYNCDSKYHWRPPACNGMYTLLPDPENGESGYSRTIYTQSLVDATCCPTRVLTDSHYFHGNQYNHFQELNS